MEAVINTLLYLGIYSFVGWICETIFCSVGQGKFVNRGFLIGPFCPIYGFGALAILYTLGYVPPTIVGIFLGGMLITSTLEYITGWAMEKIFHQKWWDYSSKRFNIHGRVCLKNSTLFGLMTLVLFFDLHPRVSTLITSLSFDLKLGFLIALSLYCAVDFSITIYNVLGIKKKLAIHGESATKLQRKLQEKYNILTDNLSLEELTKKAKELGLMNDKEKPSKVSINLLERRIFKAFPDMMSKQYKKALQNMKDQIESTKKRNKE